MKLAYSAPLLIAAIVSVHANPVDLNQQKSSSRTAGVDAGFHSRIRNSYGHLPLSFEPNHGQSSPEVKFLSRGAGYSMFLTGKGATLAFEESGAPGSRGSDIDPQRRDEKQRGRSNQAVLSMQLLGAHPNAMITGQDELPGTSNYFRGGDQKKWMTNIANYAKVRYANVFDGIDLVYYGNQGQLEYDFVVEAGANSDEIELGFTGARGIRIDRRTGDLILKVGKGTREVRFQKPVAYQEETEAGLQHAGGKHLVTARYVMDSKKHVRFQLGPYDHGRKLLIDPTLSYSTYLGGSSNDYGNSIAIDSAGSAYVTGYTNSASFPVTSGSFQTGCAGGCSGTLVDAFVAKLDPTGSFLIYSTYLGGSDNDQGNGIALDAAGDAYIVGQTFSADFPVTPGAFQSSCGGNICSGGEAFVTELNASGSALIYSTYLGGSTVNQGNSIVLDPTGDAYVIGYTRSIDFPTTPGAFQTTCVCSKNSDAFVTEFNPAGSALIYSTYLGGSGIDVGYAIALDSANNAYLTGYTQSTDFPTTAGAFQSTITANSAAFVTELNSAGSALVYSTYLGGSSTVKTTPCETCGTSIAVDSSGSAYVCGLTAESNFPITAGAYQSVFMSSTAGHDAFISKLNPTGTGLVFSTYLGATRDDGATSIALDPSGNVWLKGNTQSSDFPVTPGAFQTTLGGLFDSYVAELDPTGSFLLYSSYIGGSGNEFGGATRVLALDNQSPPNVYVTGYTNSVNYPTTPGAFQIGSGGSNDAFVTKFAPSPNVGLAPLSLDFGSQGQGTTSGAKTVTLTNTGNLNLNVSAVTITGANAGDFAQTSACSQLAPGATCTISVTFTPTILGAETASLSFTDDAANSPQSVGLSGTGVNSNPSVVFTPTSLTFNTQLIGTSSASQTVTLSNTGGGTLTITSIASSGDFSQTNNCGSSVAAGANCAITVTFKPKGPNVRSGTITVTDNASGSPQTVTLTGKGTYIVVSPTSLKFGAITVGQSSPPQVITFTNTAKVAVTIKSVSITGANARDFTQTNNCGTSVAAGANCTINVTFAPLAKGTRVGNVSIADLGGASPQIVPLSGTGQ